MRTSRATALTAAVACAGLLAACSSSSDGSGSTGTASPTPSTSASSETSAANPSTEATSAAASTGAASGGLTSTLLTAAEVGTGYTASADKSDSDSPLPCTPSAPPLFVQSPPDEKAKQGYQNSGDTVEISEVVAVYADKATAAKAYRTGAAGFDCTSGTLNNAKVTIAKRAEGAPAGSAVDELGAWDFATSGVKATAILVQVGAKLIGLTFVAQPAAAAGVEVGAITDRAATKVLQGS